jgi:hypothetical protein
MTRKTIGSRLISRPVATVETSLIWPAVATEPWVRSGDAESDRIPGQRCPEAMAFRSWHPGDAVRVQPVIGVVETFRDDPEARVISRDA